jgi:hypothetical protein
MGDRTVFLVHPDRVIAGLDYVGPTPAGVLDNAGVLVQRIAAQLGDDRGGLVLLDAKAAESLGMHGVCGQHPADTICPSCREAVPRAFTAAEMLGWSHTSPGPFVTFYRRDRPDVHVGMLDRIERQARQDALWWPFAAPWSPDMVAALQHWHRLSWLPWQAGPPVMGTELMHQLMATYRIPGQRGNFRPVKRDPDGTPEGAGESPWSPNLWYRPELATYLHGYDRRRAGLTAAGVAKLSPAALMHTPKAPFDSRRAGWWLVSVPPWNHPHMPHPFGPLEVWSRAWVTTATLDLGAELAAAGVLDMPEPIDSYTGPARPTLLPWQKRLEAVYAAPESDTYHPEDRKRVQAAAKAVGTKGIGMLNHEASSVYRPDWYHAVNATKRANLWRVAWQVGQTEHRWPVAFDDDCLWYASDDPDGTSSAPALIARNRSDQPAWADVPGNFRHQETKRQ